MFQVGLPAKSGVAGGILLVVPNVMGIMCWSPPLDKLGNSVRGIQFCTVTSALIFLFLSSIKNITQLFLSLTEFLLFFFQDLVSLCNFHNYDNLRHFAKKLDPRREGGDQRVSRPPPPPVFSSIYFTRSYFPLVTDYFYF